MAMKQEANSALIMTIGVVSGLMLLVIMFGVEAWFKFEEKQELAAKWDASRNLELEKLRADELSKITTLRWSDASKQAVTIPVSDAMRKLVADKGKMPTTRPNQ